MPWSVMRKVNRHAKHDKIISRLVVVDRKKHLYKDVVNGEYDEDQEGLVKKEPSPFPDIPSELPSSELAEHREETTAMTTQQVGQGDYAKKNGCRK